MLTVQASQHENCIALLDRNGKLLNQVCTRLLLSSLKVGSCSLFVSGLASFCLLVLVCLLLTPICLLFTPVCLLLAHFNIIIED